jgi:hypothetical protein
VRTWPGGTPAGEDQTGKSGPAGRIGRVIEQALTMVRAGGSEGLQKSLGDVLAEVGGLRG